MNCYQCEKELTVKERFVCTDCWNGMPKSLHLEWAGCSSEKGRLRVVRKVKKLVQLKRVAA